MKLPKPDLKTLPMTLGDRNQFLKEKGFDVDLCYSVTARDDNDREYQLSRLSDHIDLGPLVAEHNFYEIKRYYENMLPDVQVSIAGYAAKNKRVPVTERSTVYFVREGESITQKELDRLIELKVFL